MPLDVAIESRVRVVAQALSGRLSGSGQFIAAVSHGTLQHRRSPAVRLILGPYGEPGEPPAGTDAWTGCPRVYFSMAPTLHCLLEAIQLGAVTVLGPHVDLDGIGATLRATRSGEPLVSPTVLLRRLSWKVTEPTRRRRPRRMTVRQLEVGCALARGIGYREIAERFEREEDTVVFHVRNLLKLTGATHRSELAELLNRPLPDSFYPQPGDIATGPLLIPGTGPERARQHIA